jgi:predicted RNA-binding Zn ribbon-like protein
MVTVRTAASASPQCLDLPEALALPLPSGAPYWYWLGNRPALDFVNTLRERWRRRVETLTDAADLGAWLDEAGLLLDGTDAAIPPAVVNEARALREAIDGAVIAAVAGRPLPVDGVALIDDWLVHAGTRPALLVAPGGEVRLGERAAADSPRRALGMIAFDAAQMLGTPAELARIRICGADDCSARFYDRSPAARRRWCSMQTCGNAAKVRAHRARVKAGAQ